MGLQQGRGEYRGASTEGRGTGLHTMARTEVSWAYNRGGGEYRGVSTEGRGTGLHTMARTEVSWAYNRGGVSTEG